MCKENLGRLKTSEDQPPRARCSRLMEARLDEASLVKSKDR